MKIRDKVVFTIIVTFAIVFFLYKISDILLPFVIGIILAYFLDPAADKLESWGCSRTFSTSVILLIFLCLIVVFSVTLGPIMYKQTISLIHNTPNYLNYLNDKITPYVNSFYSIIGYQNGYGTNGEIDLLKETSEFAVKVSSKFVSNIWSSSIALVQLLSMFFISPIVTFYLLRDWDKIIAKGQKLIPKRSVASVTKQFKAIDATLSAYVRGQTNVALLLGLFYAIGLSVKGLNYGILIGFLTGIFSFVPYFGVFTGMVVALIIGYLQFGTMSDLGVIFSIFMVGQFIEGNFVGPKLVGDKIGVHPVLIIFSLLTGGVLFGFVGVLFAIPAIAILSVVFNFQKDKYLKSSYYIGTEKAK